MSNTAFRKALSSNDVGKTGGHQGGVLIPKGNRELLGILPSLDPGIKNPEAWLACIDQHGTALKLRFVYYNNKLHDPGGTRDEYRITHMTAWFRNQRARDGDIFEIGKDEGHSSYRIQIIPWDTFAVPDDNDGRTRIRLRGWRRVH